MGNYNRIMKFDNGYVASIVCNKISYGGLRGLFEVAVCVPNKNDDLDIVYDTPVTDDVVGNLDFAQVADVLEKIKNLPPRKEN